MFTCCSKAFIYQSESTLILRMETAVKSEDIWESDEEIYCVDFYLRSLTDFWSGDDAAAVL